MPKPPMTPEQRQMRARLAAARRHGRAHAEVADLTRRLRVSRAADYIAELLAAEPVPNNDERGELAAMFVPEDDGPTAA